MKNNSAGIIVNTWDWPQGRTGRRFLIAHHLHDSAGIIVNNRDWPKAYLGYPSPLSAVSAGIVNSYKKNDSAGIIVNNRDWPQAYLGCPPPSQPFPQESLTAIRKMIPSETYIWYLTTSGIGFANPGYQQKFLRNSTLLSHPHYSAGILMNNRI